MLARYGLPFYSRIGQQGGSVVKARHGRAFYQAIGSKGGRVTRARGGTAFYATIGRKGGLRPHGNRSARSSEPDLSRPPEEQEEGRA